MKVRRIAVRGVAVDDGKLLCALAKQYNDRVDGKHWCVPGGGVDTDEPLISAFEREIQEETGIKPAVGNLLYIQQFSNDDNQEDMELFFHITNPKDYLDIDLTKSTHGDVEITEIGFKDPTKIDLLPTFLQTESFDNLDSKPTKFFSYL